MEMMVLIYNRVIRNSGLDSETGKHYKLIENENNEYEFKEITENSLLEGEGNYVVN